MDTMGEFLTRIRNAVAAGHEKVDVPNSNIRTSVAEVLRDTGYIRNFKLARDGRQGIMRVYLKYSEKGQPRIEVLERVSKPSRRIYIKAGEIPKVRSGYGLAVLSTNKGVMSGDEAQKQGVGGEYLLRVW